MIPKAERDADAAILAALPKYIEIDEDGSVWDCSGHGAHVARVGDATDADIRKAAAHAVNRLPVYIEAMAEMERRIDALIDHLSGRVEELDEAGGSKSDRQYGVMAGLAQARKAVRDILRGGK